jgi:hypothetical protein
LTVFNAFPAQDFIRTRDSNNYTFRAVKKANPRGKIFS